MVPTFCRTTRAQTLTVKHADFITAGTLCGASKATITFRHVFPNCVSLNTLTYCDFPSEHWTRIRTNNVIERLNREIRRRTRVVGTFPDGNSALMLVCARLRHVAGTQWGSKKYMNMKHLEAVMDDASIAG